MSSAQGDGPRQLDEMPDHGRVVLVSETTSLDAIERVAREHNADWMLSPYAPEGQCFVVNMDAFLDLPDTL